MSKFKGISLLHLEELAFKRGGCINIESDNPRIEFKRKGKVYGIEATDPNNEGDYTNFSFFGNSEFEGSDDITFVLGQISNFLGNKYGNTPEWVQKSPKEPEIIKLTALELLKELCQKRNWYKGTDLSKASAFNAKKLILENQISETWANKILNQLGYKKISETWSK